MKLIVTAGGQGTKLWPYSREDKPKQFQPVIGDKSLYVDNVETLLKKYPPEDIFISTKRKFIKYISEQTPQIPLKNYIIEPDIAKDRGPAEGLAFLKLSMLFPDEPFFLVQADCARRPAEAFLKMIEDAGTIVARDKKFISGGIKATEPMLGVDYLQLGNRVLGESKLEVYEIDDFVGRKTNYHETKELVEGYHVVTHCNHSCWYPDLILQAYQKHRPDWYAALMKIRDTIDKPGEDVEIEKIYAQMEKGPTEDVTKHVMKDGQIILLPFKWADIGTWGSVYEFFADGKENYLDGKVVSIDSQGSLIKTSNEKKLIAVAGIDNIVVVDTEDILLIIPKDKIDKIKDLQAELNTQGIQEYL